MLSRKRIKLLLLLFIIFVLSSACSHSEQGQQMVFAPPPAPASGPPDRCPPQPEETQEAIKRIYGQTVTIESWRNQYFIAGDLNGDGSPDLAVVVRPAAGHLEELNHELANWIRGDPQKVTLPDPRVRVHHLPGMAPEPIVISQNDVLLAIIHGYGPRGWRDPQARQSYLLKNTVGGSMSLQTTDEALKLAASGARSLRLQGDVVWQTLANEKGLLYFTGAKYAWHRLSPSRS